MIVDDLFSIFNDIFCGLAEHQSNSIFLLQICRVKCVLRKFKAMATQGTHSVSMTNIVWPSSQSIQCSGCQSVTKWNKQTIQYFNRIENDINRMCWNHLRQILPIHKLLFNTMVCQRRMA